MKSVRLVLLLAMLSVFVMAKAEERPVLKKLHAEGIEHFYYLSPGIYSGGTPQRDEAFAELAKRGVKVLISVDGARPDVESAQRHGLRYVHLPHGYDGVSTNHQWQLIKAARELPRPVFVHCHHGQHRGPTAAAILCMANEGWTREQAEQWLRAAGTSTNYAGLYQTVRRFEPPTEVQLLGISTNFPSTAKASGLVEAMVQIDLAWDHLKLIRASGYRPPASQPDLTGADEAFLLREHYREALRLPEATGRGGEFIDLIQKAENEAAELASLFRAWNQKPSAELHEPLAARLDSVGQSCVGCHRVYRDKR